MHAAEAVRRGRKLGRNIICLQRQHASAKKLCLGNLQTGEVL